MSPKRKCDLVNGQFEIFSSLSFNVVVILIDFYLICNEKNPVLLILQTGYAVIFAVFLFRDLKRYERLMEKWKDLEN